MFFKMSIYARPGRLGLIDGVDQDRRWIGSAVFGRRGTGWRPRRDPASAEGRGSAAHARQWADDEVRADRSYCAEAIPDRRARRRARGEDDARPDSGVSRRWRANRNPRLRQLLAPFPPRASCPQPQDRYDDVASGQARPLFQAGQEAARTRQSRVSRAARSAAARGRIRGSAGAETRCRVSCPIQQPDTEPDLLPGSGRISRTHHISVLRSHGPAPFPAPA